MKTNKKQKYLNFLFLLFYPLIASLVSFRLGVNALLSTVVFFGIPAIYLSYRKPSFIKKALLFSSLSIPVMIVIDYIAELTGTWVWPIPTSIFPKLFGYVSFEVILWAYLHCFVVVMFYEYFFDKRTRSKLIYPREKSLLLLSLSTLGVFLLFLFFSRTPLFVPYWYFIFSLIFIIPPVMFEGYKFPKVFLRLVRASAYFLYLNLVYELTALKIGWWSFPSKQYIGWVSFFSISFPFEEFFFWIILFTLAALSYYEYFFDREV